MQFIDLKRQYQLYKRDIDQAIQGVLEDGRYVLGPSVGDLESQLADYCGAKHCLGVSSGTCSLQIALMALGIGPGDEVITVPFTWISTAEVIKLVGAKPVFVDIDLDTYNMDPQCLEEAITPRTKAIIAVDLFGQMADYKRICPIAEKYGIPIIEDAAQSFGATQDGRKAGSITQITSTSFFPAKPLGCYGDGGALFCEDDDLMLRMRAIHNHGGLRRHHHEWVGMNARLDSLQAAILLVKLQHFDEEIQARFRIGARYTDLLKDACVTPSIFPGNTHLYAIYTLRSPYRDDVVASLQEKGIPSPVYYPKCLHQQPVFADLGYQNGDFPRSEQAAREVFSIPMHPWLEEKDQNLIIEAVEEAICTMI